MDRYTQLFPSEPNPNDSYGELLRMAGNFEGSLTHYRAALKIDPTFVTSQVGIADTYALMGNQQQARVEYDKAIAQAHNEADRIDYMMQKALTYVRENNFAEADKAFDGPPTRRTPRASISRNPRRTSACRNIRPTMPLRSIISRRRKKRSTAAPTSGARQQPATCPDPTLADGPRRARQQHRTRRQVFEAA